jgi:hypothetical protein
VASDVTIDHAIEIDEPHYQLPSSEPVPPISVENELPVSESNTYDIPRLIETPSIENMQITAQDKVKLSSNDFVRR